LPKIKNMLVSFKNRFSVSFVKVFAFVVFSVFYSCKNKQSELAVKREGSVFKVSKQEKIISTDSISVFGTSDVKGSDVVLAHLLQTKIDKDSMVKAYYRLDFFSKKSKIKSFDLELTNFENGSEWSSFYGLSVHEPVTSSFIQISFGYPACGYSQEHFLFYKNKGAVELVHKWSSSSDSGWGSWVVFSRAKSNSETVFYCHTVSFSADDDNEDMGVVFLSDSIQFKKKNNKWIKKFSTPKDFVYSEKKESFDAFYSVEE
jgi:hypothetical protein